MKRFYRIGLPLAAFVLAAAVLVWWGYFRPLPPLPRPPNPFPPAAPVSGAAVYYNQAFAVMPKLTEKERKALLKGIGPKLEEVDRDLVASVVERFAPALDLLAQGAREPSCEWGIDLNKVGTAPVPHLSPALQCIQALAGRARLRMDAGQSEAAVDDLLTGLRFNRDIQKPATWICLTVRSSFESVLLMTAGRGLAKLDAQSLERLEQGIHALPEALPFSDSVEFKRRIVMNSVYDFVDRLKAGGKEGEFIEAFFSEKELLALKKASRGKLDSWIDAVESDYSAIGKASWHPFLEAKREIEAISGKKNQNPLEHMMLPSVFCVYETIVRCQGVWSIFLTVLDARLRHPGEERARVAAVIDPFSGEPVQVREVPGGIKVDFCTDPSKKTSSLTLLLDSAQPTATSENSPRQ